MSAIWGSSFLFIKLSVKTINPTVLTFYRLLIASLFLLFFKVKIFENLKKNIKGILLIAILGNLLPFNLISWSELYVDSVVASSLIGTMPIFTFIISLMIFKDTKPSLFQTLGLIIGFCGMIIFIGLDFNSLKGDSFFFSLVILFSALCYALSATCVKLIKGQTALEIASTSTILATLFSFPVMVWFLVNSDKPILIYLKTISFESIVAATTLGILCTGVAIIIFFKLIQRKSAVFASQSNYLIPCFGFLWSFIFLEEKLTINLFIGLIMIVFGGYLLNSKKS